MKPLQILSKDSATVLTMVMAGCTAYLHEGIGSAPATVQSEFVSQSEAQDLAFKYRQQTADFRDMARGLDAEVQWLTGHGESTDEEVRLSREKAQQLWTAADQAEQLARDYRRQAPHG